MEKIIPLIILITFLSGCRTTRDITGNATSNQEYISSIYLPLAYVNEPTESLKKLESKRDEELSRLFRPKNEFETNVEYEKRIRQAKLIKEKVIGDYENSINALKRNYYPYKTVAKLGEYDADNGGFKAEVEGGKVFIKVPRNIARKLKGPYRHVEGMLRYFNSDKTEMINAYLVDEISGRKFPFGKHAEDGIVTSTNDGQDNLSSSLLTIPVLSYSVVLEDSNHNDIIEGGEQVSLAVRVKNIGKDVARDVSVTLSGDRRLLNIFGGGERKRLIINILGDILPSEEKIAKFEAIFPTELKARNAKLDISVSESRGYSPTEEITITAAVKPADIRKTEQIISRLTDVGIIPTKIKNYVKENSFAIVIGISNYRDEIIPNVKYAKSDAEILSRYLENVGGIPRKNMKLLTDDGVTKGDLEAYLEDWLPRRVKKDSEVFIYFAGHGTPDPEGKEAFIVPYDGDPDFKSKLYPLKRMYASLNKLPAGQVVVMLDSCFSGAGGRSIIAEGARPITLSIENPVLAGGKISVLAASTGSQISSDYDRVKHGLFTYFLLKGMKGEADSDTNGKVELRELYEYIKENVEEIASIELNRDQTPVLLPDLKQNGHGQIEITRVR